VGIGFFQRIAVRFGGQFFIVGNMQLPKFGAPSGNRLAPIYKAIIEHQQFAPGIL
jgi:hypothetical protein